MGHCYRFRVILFGRTYLATGSGSEQSIPNESTPHKSQLVLRGVYQSADIRNLLDSNNLPRMASFQPESDRGITV